MERIRRAGMPAIALLLFGAVAAMAAPALPSATPAAIVGWPPSTGLLLAEVVTGGASASDEYVEITNASAASLDLLGLELVYVTSSGATVSRKASWSTSRPLEPGRHLLLANVLGRYASIADATYSGGLAATGGALVLRPTGGAPLDAVGWGDATNGFVEGTAAPAPPAGSSIERRPGGIAGNTSDTNDNASDWFVQAEPAAQNSSAPPTPAFPPTPTPSADATSEPSPTAQPTGEPSAAPSPSPEATPSMAPSPSPSPQTSPAPPPSAAPESSPSPSPDPATISIAEARSLPEGTRATIVGVLTTPLGAIDAGHGAFVQDATAGIALYLDPLPSSTWPTGSLVRASGVIDVRYAQTALRAAPADLALLGAGEVPPPVSRPTGVAGEADEGLRLRAGGTVVGSPSALTDGTAVTIDDGSGPLRVVVTPAALDGRAIVPGDRLDAVGPLGQRDSTGTGTSGYRLFVTDPGDLVVTTPPSGSPEPSSEPTPQPTATPSSEPTPQPTATPSADPTPEPTPTPVPTPSPSATPAPEASASPSPSDAPIGIGDGIAAAREAPLGSVVRVRGVVTAEAGRLGTPPLVAIADETGGIAVRLPEGVDRPARGTIVAVEGPLAAPYGQTEIRPTLAGYATFGSGSLPTPRPVERALGEEDEGLLVVLTGTPAGRPSRTTSGDLTVVVRVGGADVRVQADRSSGIEPEAIEPGFAYRLTGIVGQRASRRGVLDGYRLWLRDPADVVRTGVASAPNPSPSASPAPARNGPRREPTEPSPEPSPAGPISIAAAVTGGAGREVTVEGIVTAPATLLDRTGRRTVAQDASGAIELYLAADVAVPSPGDRVRATGGVGRAYGAPRLRVARLAVVGRGAVRPVDLRGAPGAAHEWRLVRASGRVERVRRLGDRWLAELVAGRDRILVAGLAGAGIPSTAIVEGRQATVVGIARRPHPSATDRRFAIVPRSPADVALGPAREPAAGTRGSAPAARPPGSSTGSRAGSAGARDAFPAEAPIDVATGELDEHVDRLVRVGGFVVHLAAAGFTLDDGSGPARVVLRGRAADYLALLEPEDPLNAIGRVVRDADGAAVVVDDPAGLQRVGELGEPVALDPALGSATREAADPADGDLDREAVRVATTGEIGLPLPGAPLAGVGSLLLLTLAWVGLAALRERRVRAAIRSRVVARLGSIRTAGRALGRDAASR